VVVLLLLLLLLLFILVLVLVLVLIFAVFFVVEDVDVIGVVGVEFGGEGEMGVGEVLGHGFEESEHFAFVGVFGEGAGFVGELPEPAGGPVLFERDDAEEFLGAFEGGVGDDVGFGVAEDLGGGDWAVGEEGAEPVGGGLGEGVG